MIPFKEHKKYSLTEAVRLLTELSSSDMRNYLRSTIDTASDEELSQMMKAVERPAIEAKVTEVFRAKKLDQYIDTSAWDTLVKQLLKVNATIDEKIEFCNNLITGKYIDPKAYIKSTKGNVKNFIKASDKVMKALFPWFLSWKPEIDVVAVGPAEAIFIFCAADGKKGDPAGDIYMGGKVIEMKVSGGSMGKKGETMWTSTKGWFASTVKSMLSDSLGNKSDADVLKFAPMGGSHDSKSIRINTLSTMMHAKGFSDKDISQFWMDWTSQAMKAKLSKPIKVSKGVVDYDSFVRYITGVGYVKYKEQTGFDMVSLLDKDTGNFINFTTGEDFMDRSDYMLDASMDWNGGGQGGGLTGRLETKSGTHTTVRSAIDLKLIDKQYKEISMIGKAVNEMEKADPQSKKFSNQRDKALTLLKKIKISPRIPHQSKITASTNPTVAAALRTATKQDLSSWVNKKIQELSK